MFGSKKNSDGTHGKLQIPLIAIGAVCGILLLVFANSSERGTANEKETPGTYDAETEIAAYRASLEQNIRGLCESVEGVGNVTVALTLSGGFCDVYATEISGDGSEKYVIVGSGSNAGALLLTRTAPEVVGIGIVCRGGSNADIRQELTALLSAAYRIPSNRIYVTEAKRSADRADTRIFV